MGQTAGKDDKNVVLHEGHMYHRMRKPTIWVSDQVQQRLVCTVAKN